MQLPDWDSDIEFYDDTYYGGPIDLSAMGICGKERDDFHRELLRSTPALEKEIRRRDDTERADSEASQRASTERARLRRERETIQAAIQRTNKLREDMRRAGMPPDAELEALLNSLTSLVGAVQ